MITELEVAEQASQPTRPVDGAIQRARRAGQEWGGRSVEDRIARLEPVVEAIARRESELVDGIVIETGKPRVEAISHEVGPCLAMARWLFRHAPGALAPRRVFMPWMPHRRATIFREPHGVTLVISPWNLPFAIPFGQVLTALVAGNGVVLKPSEITPRASSMIADVLSACDLPEGLFQVIQGDGSVGAELLAAGPDHVVFTGSVATGRKVMAAAASHPIPVSLELGGVDAMIVCEDANLEYAASAAAWGATCNGGQVCASVERLFVHESIREPFLERLADKLNRLRAGQDLGRITNPLQETVYKRHLDDARARRLQFVMGGEEASGGVQPPALLTGPDIEQSAIYTEETFGPAVAAVGFDDDDDLVARHNDTPFGLTASVFSGDRRRARRIAGRLRAGLVSINDIAATLHSQPELPWGGVGHSGFGRSHGEEGIQEATRAKVVEEGRWFDAALKRPWWYPYEPALETSLSSLGAAIAARGLPARALHALRSGLGLLKMLARSPRL